MKLVKSFGYAFCGIWHCINSQRNMRIHICAAALVLLFSPFFSLTSVQYAVLFVLIGLVFALEMINTALESAADAITKEYHPKIKILKDVAAGAVLIMAIASVAVAVAFFWQAEGFCRIYEFYCNYPWMIAVTAAGIALAIFFIIISPRDLYRRIKGRR